MDIALNTINNTSAEQFLHELESEFIDLTVTSPPYDQIREYQGFSFNLDVIVKQLFRATKTGGICVWIVGDQCVNGSETGTSFRQALKFMEAGWNLHDTMIYEKDSIAFPEVNRYSQIFEYMFVFSKGKPKTVNIIKDRKNLHFGNKKITGRERQVNGDLVKKRKGNDLKEFGSRFNIWRIPSGKNKSTKDTVAFEHPAIFPEKLVGDHIKSWSNEGDVVCDIFSGSATTAKMAYLLNRYFIGSELALKYFDIGNKRLSAYTNSTLLF